MFQLENSFPHSFWRTYPILPTYYIFFKHVVIINNISFCKPLAYTLLLVIAHSIFFNLFLGFWWQLIEIDVTYVYDLVIHIINISQKYF